MKSLLEELKERSISVSFCARLLGMSKRTLQDHLDIPGRLTALEDKQLRAIIKNYDGLVASICEIK